jgi:hypothetical protein
MPPPTRFMSMLYLLQHSLPFTVIPKGGPNLTEVQRAKGMQPDAHRASREWLPEHLKQRVLTQIRQLITHSVVPLWFMRCTAYLQ